MAHIRNNRVLKRDLVTRQVSYDAARITIQRPNLSLFTFSTLNYLTEENAIALH